MKILVVSDSHGNTNRLEDVLEAEQDAEAVVFLGDGLRDMQRLEGLHPELCVYSVSGNCDYASFAPAEGLAPFGGVLVLYTHGHLYRVKDSSDALAQTAQLRGAQVVLYGHTHAQSCEQVDGVTLFNPGAICGAYGGGSACYGVMTVQDGKAAFLHKHLG
ncbi:MAG: metallophosphoesterase [Ruthenibacterium sp.]